MEPLTRARAHRDHATVIFSPRARRLGAPGALLALVASQARAYVALSEPPATTGGRDLGVALMVADRLDDAVTQTWTTDDGLPSIVTLALAQTQEGLIWAATEHGLARFDGRAWTTVVDRVAVNALQIVGRDLWVGTGEGLARVVDGELVRGPHEGLLERRAVRALAAEGSRLYAGTTSGELLALEGARLARRWSAAEGLPAAAITRLLVVGDHIAVGTEHGLRIVDSASGSVGVIEGPLANATITGLASDGGSLLIATFEHGLFRCTGARCQPFVVEGLEVGAHLGQPLVLGDETLLLPTAAALLVVRANAVVDRHAELAGSLVSLFRDRDGTLWAGTGNDGRLGGLRSLRYRGLRVWLPGQDGRAILEGRDGSTFLATNAGGLFRRAATGAVTQVPLAIGELRSVRSLQADPAMPGATLVAGLGGALRIREDGAQEVLTTGALPSSRIRAIRRLEDGRLVLATQAGVLVGQEGAAFSLLPGSPSTWFTVGLTRVDAHSWLVPTSEDGLWRVPSSGGTATRVELDPWTGAVGRPLVHASGRVVVPHDSGVCVLAPSLALEACFGVDQGFALKGHVGLVDDERGSLWLSHTGGLSVVAWSELLEAARAPGAAAKPFRTLRHLTVRDGLPSNGCNGGDANAVRLASGDLAFACMGGFAIVDPARATTDPRLPSVFVHEIDVDGDRHRASFAEPLASTTQRITFAFGAPSFLGNERNQAFRVKLEGFDRDWVDADRRTMHASYTNLPRGRALRFLVKATNNDGVWNEAPAVVAFTITPKPHERLPVQLAFLAGVVGLATAGYKARTRTLKARAVALEGVVAERTAALQSALRELRDDLAEARRFQELTMGTLPAVRGLDLASRWLPASTVGGDLYLAEVRPEGLRVLLVDATGHGVQAALRTMVLKTAFDAISKAAATPGDLLTKLNEMLVASYGEFEAKTDAIAVDLTRDEAGALVLRLATAGSLSLALVHEGALRELRVPGFALGVTSGRTYATLEAPFPLGAAALLVTDGVLEQPNASGEAFEWPRFEHVGLTANGSADVRAQAIADAWSAHRGPATQTDDATILVVTRNGT